MADTSDDLLVTSNNVKLVDEFFEDMKAFDVKDLDVAATFWGIKIEYQTACGHESANNYLQLDQTVRPEEHQTCWNTDSRSSPLYWRHKPVASSRSILDPHFGWHTFVDRHMHLNVSWFYGASNESPDACPSYVQLQARKRILRYLFGANDYKLEVMKIGEANDISFEFTRIMIGQEKTVTESLRMHV